MSAADEEHLRQKAMPRGSPATAGGLRREIWEHEDVLLGGSDAGAHMLCDPERIDVGPATPGHPLPGNIARLDLPAVGTVSVRAHGVETVQDDAVTGVRDRLLRPGRDTRMVSTVS
ncbi:hypothetical protein [Streptomyces flavidovirens]|uniref:hypothetical protein n=1 Tax=Streptomyces flavidovirens TaxID=67298 RepID=UPI003F5736C7